MKQIIDSDLAYKLRGNLNMQIFNANLCVTALEDSDRRENPSGEESDVRVALDELNRALASLILVDDRLKHLVPDSKLFSLPPAPIVWLLRLLKRIKG